eukprot:CAMPEP_0203657744 /NCGR_PEP_ID=MMETSP0088-20131115/45981_1 /ASSEMBLY_ACC=CAM_ASM_001087 /TAXON_ID=426623 /ORGANISM="Chaetoceros affinis, Strain CCMP159" /LENGTH=343 /DNA_ID=CAMNT_0050519197 /DNA_START=125 /DNA_END=1156 /DNA_ORIENTATION=+
MTIVNRKNSAVCVASVLLILSLDSSSAFAPPQSPSLVSTTSPSTTHHRLHNRLYALTTEEEAKAQQKEQKEEILNEASEALTSVGWSAPMAEDELTSDDPFVQKINAQIQEESGVNLDELLNPAKVVNLERDLVNLRSELATLTGMGNDIDVMNSSTEECDGGGGGEDADKIRTKIEKKERDLLIERRSVFRGWLKNVFLGQAVLSLGLSWIMATDPSILFGSFDWYNNVRSIDVSIQVLGFWWWWLFIVPSLRSRRPKGFEKKALDIAFIGTPAVSLIAPAATKDTALIWIANFVLVAGAYAFSYATYDENESGDDSKQPEWLKFVMKSLDFGVGKERGARK